MKLLDNEYISISFDIQTSMMFVVRKTEVLKNDDNYKKTILIWKEIIEEHKPQKQLIDYSDFSQAISPEMQTWINENLIYPAIKAGLKKNAIIISKDKLAQISVEQTMDEIHGLKVFNKYYDNKEDAINWLNE